MGKSTKELLDSVKVYDGLTYFPRRMQQQAKPPVGLRTSMGTLLPDGSHRLGNHDRYSDVGDTGVSMTKQADAAECDINNIMKRYEETGALPTLIKQDPMYGDFSAHH